MLETKPSKDTPDKVTALLHGPEDAAFAAVSAEREGLISLRDDGMRLVREGRTSVAEVLRNTHAGTLRR